MSQRKILPMHNNQSCYHKIAFYFEQIDKSTIISKKNTCQSALYITSTVHTEDFFYVKRADLSRSFQVLEWEGEGKIDT
jgi:hypothetical protein